MFVCLSVSCLLDCRSVCLSICLSVVCRTVCLSVCLYIAGLFAQAFLPIIMAESHKKQYKIKTKKVLNSFSCDAYTLLVVELMDIIALKPQSVSHSRVKSNHENAGGDYQDHPNEGKGLVHPVLRPGINTLISLLHKFIH